MTIVEQEVIAPAEVTVREVLHRAADLLEEFGWMQFCYGSKSQGAFCLLGAGVEAWSESCGASVERFSQGWIDREHEIMEALRPAFGNEDPAHWNDRPERTRAEVVARLRQAAEAAA